jgi:hypothetical protein
MNFERSDILRPILDDLETNDETIFHGLQQKVLADASGRGMLNSTATVSLVFQALRDKLTERAEIIVSEIRRVLTGAYIEDFDNLVEALKLEWNSRMESARNIASSEFQRGTASIRSQLSHPNMPSESAIAEHVAKLRAKCLAEIDLFCINLHDGQAPRLFLKAGEVFAGNRAARAIFSAATRSLDIIDTYFGSSVFDMLEVTAASVGIRLITNRVDNPTRLAYTQFNQQFPNRVQFRLCDPTAIKLHDRFVVVDGARALHLGGSIKDLAKVIL